MDMKNPKKNAFLGSFKGELDLSAIVQLVIDLASNSKQGGGGGPTFPLLVLRKLKIKLSMTTLVINVNGTEEKFEPGFAFECDLEIFGLGVRAGIYIGSAGFSAHLGLSKPIKFFSALEVCKTRECRGDEGPLAFVKMKLKPPKFNVRVNAYVNLFGNKFSTAFKSFWEGKPPKLMAKFSAVAISVAGGALKLLAPSPGFKPTRRRLLGSDPGGPLCTFSANDIKISLAGRIQLLDVSVDGLVEISPARFLLRVEMSFFHFYFAVQVSGGIPFVGGEGSGGLTIRLEAGSKAGQDLRQKIRDGVVAKLNQWKEDGERAINSAQGELEKANKEFAAANKELEHKKKVLDAAKRTAAKISCSVEEAMVQTSDGIGPQARHLLSTQSRAASKNEALTTDINVDLAVADHVKASEGTTARTKSRSKTTWGHRWHRWSPPHVHVPHVHVPHFHSKAMKDAEAAARKAAKDAKDARDAAARRAAAAARKAAKDAKDAKDAAARRAAAAAAKAAKDAKDAKDAAERAAKEAARKACEASRTVAAAAVEAAKGPFTLAQENVKIAKGAVDSAKAGLDVAKAANKGVWNIMEGLVTAVLGVEYLMVQATLRLNVLDSCLSGEMRYSIDGKTHPWSGSVCLRDLAGLIGELFKKCIGNLGG